eukprot:COSAG01_NODE_550_length_15593_cov_12.422422_2_plen_68_part_00
MPTRSYDASVSHVLVTPLHSAELQHRAAFVRPVGTRQPLRLAVLLFLEGALQLLLALREVASTAKTP